MTFLVIYTVVPNGDKRNETSWGAFNQFIDKGQIKTLRVDGTEIHGTLKGDNRKFVVYGPIGEDLQARLASQASRDPDFTFTYKKQERESLLQSVLISWLPMLLLFFIFFIFMRNLQSGGGKAMSFGKSKAKLLNESSKKITFDDIAGVEEGKVSSTRLFTSPRSESSHDSVVGFPKAFCSWDHLNGQDAACRGVAGEAGSLFSISGFIVDVCWCGRKSSSRPLSRGKNALCIIFIDEIDAVGRHRGHRPGWRTRRT